MALFRASGRVDARATGFHVLFTLALRA